MSLNIFNSCTFTNLNTYFSSLDLKNLDLDLPPELSCQWFDLNIEW
eukprot:CAMPEP_0202980090 /NCGR_PEP_ID=MMETSP1396-20130829/86084_1 /ASSEMBLY_ACC=CAM_ASM_000872 /TAXON_ID= /ORGANISM="Pseudokeronopsis sp., Strain Brazil" /LENGTH=45 /DNA_ID= /DNA_START= /DNA_END= /DNA_ORIENTATION=